MGVLLRVVAVLVGAFLMTALLRGASRRPRVRAGVVMEASEVVSSEGFVKGLCDGCGVRAYAIGWLLPKDPEKEHRPLYFCLHHWRLIEDPATEFEYFVDETDRV